MKIGGAISRDGSEPAWKILGIAQGGELGESLEKDVLNEVFHLVRSDAREQDTVNHAGIAGVEVAVGGAVAFLCGANQGSVRGSGIRQRTHGWKPCARWGDFIERGHDSTNKRMSSSK
jgi:hypothetical protein